jgi:hypothetical protein
LFSGIGVAAVAEFDHDIQALGGCHCRVVVRVGRVGVREAVEHPHRFLHDHNYTRLECPHPEAISQ